MSTFHLPSTSNHPPIPVTLPPHISESELQSFPAFTNWLTTLQQSLSQQTTSPTHAFHASPYHLRSITVKSIVRFSGNRIGFLTLSAEVTNDEGEWLPGTVFMRGGAVAVLVVLEPVDDDGGVQSDRGGSVGREGDRGRRTDGTDRTGEGGKEEYVILTVQPRVAAGSLGFIELPAGMLDGSGSFGGTAAKEIEEETGLTIAENELVNMSALAEGCLTEDERRTGTEVHLQAGMYPSAGGSDEFIPLFLARKKMKKGEIEGMRGRLTGLRDEGEKITLKVVRLQDAWKVGSRDSKTLAALTLYNELKKEGKI